MADSDKTREDDLRLLGSPQEDLRVAKGVIDDNLCPINQFLDPQRYETQVSGTCPREITYACRFGHE